MALASALIGFLALLSRRNSITNLTFIAFTFFTPIWIVSNFLSNNTNSQSEAIFWNKVIMSSTTLLFGSLILFSYNYPLAKAKSVKTLLTICGVTLVIAIMAMTDLIVKDVKIREGFSEIIFGDLFFIYFLYALFAVGFMLFSLISKYRKFTGIEKLRLRFILYGLILVALGGLVFNLLLPTLLSDFSLSNFGPLFVIFFELFIFIGITQYRILDIRLLLGKFVYYVVLGSISYVTFYAVYIFDTRYFENVFSTGAMIIGAIFSLLFVVLFNEANKYIQTQVNLRLINPGYNPLLVIDRFSRGISTSVNITDTVDQTLDTLSKSLRANYEAILIIPEGKKNILFYESKKQKKQFSEIVARELINIWNKDGKDIVNYDTYTEHLPTNLKKYSNSVEKILHHMEEKNIKVLAPLTQGDKTLGFIMLGQKEADTPYSSRDIEFIQGIANNAGLAVARSLYYVEVQDLNKNLQKRVDEATKDLAIKNTRLERALKRLEQIRRQERDMVDVMGHELRTPITIVRNALIVLQSKLKEGEEISRSKLIDYIDKSVESTKREIVLIETLLSATKIEANRIQLHFTKVDMIDVINDGIEGQKAFAQQRGIKVKFQKPKKEYFAFCDRTRVQEIVDNFLSNAIKYTIRGHVEILIKQDKEMVTISVKDTGIGISKEDLEKLGEKFFRAKQYVDASLESHPGVTRPGGTGLGLYVSFNMIRIMGGKFNVESKLGKGSTFSFSMPLYTGQPDKDFDQTFDEEEI